MEALHDLIGSDGGTITWWQMSLRAVVIFLYLLVLVRLGGRRAFGQWTAFDIVLGVLLGSSLSRCLTGNAPFLPTLAAGAVLVALHVVLAKLALRFGFIGLAAKGRAVKLVEDGRLLRSNMRRCQVTERDLLEHLRSSLQTNDLTRVREAYLERGGNVSFIT